MRSSLFAVLFILIALLDASSQTVILIPEAGIQTFRRDVRNFSSSQGVISYSARNPSFGARMMYVFKNGDGPYLGFNYSNLTISSFYNGNYNATKLPRYRYELGYQLLSHPIYFKHFFRNNALDSLANKGWYLRLRPSLGLAYVTGTARSGASVFPGVQEGQRYSNLGLTAGIGFVFEKNGRELFNLSLRGTRSMYNSSTHSANPSSFNFIKDNGGTFSIGIPITLFKKH